MAVPPNAKGGDEVKASPLAESFKAATKFLKSLPMISGSPLVARDPTPGITDAELDQWYPLDSAIANAARDAGFPITNGPDKGRGFTKLLTTAMRMKWEGDFRRAVFVDEWLERMNPWIALATSGNGRGKPSGKATRKTTTTIDRDLAWLDEFDRVGGSIAYFAQTKGMKRSAMSQALTRARNARQTESKKRKSSRRTRR